jgi:hypothetical protein
MDKRDRELIKEAVGKIADKLGPETKVKLLLEHALEIISLGVMDEEATEMIKKDPSSVDPVKFFLEKLALGEDEDLDELPGAISVTIQRPMKSCHQEREWCEGCNFQPTCSLMLSLAIENNEPII